MSRHFYLVIFGLLLGDLLSKLFFFYVFPFGTEIKLIPYFLEIRLVLNPLPFRDAIIANQLPSSIDVTQKWKYLGTSLSLIVLSLYIFYSPRLPLRSFAKYIVGMFIYIVLYLLFSLLILLFEAAPPYPLLLTSMLVAKVVVPIFLFYIVEPWGLKVAFSLLIAANLGNLLSFTYFPYRVIDFVFSPLLYQTLEIGVFNLADIYGSAFMIVLISYIIPAFFYQAKEEILSPKSLPK